MEASQKEQARTDTGLLRLRGGVMAGGDRKLATGFRDQAVGAERQTERTNSPVIVAPGGGPRAVRRPLRHLHPGPGAKLRLAAVLVAVMRRRGFDRVSDPVAGGAGRHGEFRNDGLHQNGKDRQPSQNALPTATA